MIEIYLIARNRLLECREMLLPEWEERMQGEDLLARFRAMDFMENTKDAEPLKVMDINLMLRTADCIKAFEGGMVVTDFWTGRRLNIKRRKAD